MTKDNLEPLSMRTLFVHERFGALGGAEANILLTAGELRRRGHTVGILHGPGTGRCETQWSDIFSRTFSLRKKEAFESVQSALWEFEPDLLYVHKMPELDVMEALLGSGIPVVRMIHDTTSTACAVINTISSPAKSAAARPRPTACSAAPRF